jgi:hypothetical protein
MLMIYCHIRDVNMMGMISVHANEAGVELTNLSSSEDRPAKQLFFILLMATSLPLHFPWYTVPNVPEPSSLSSSRSSFLIIYEDFLKNFRFQ